MLLKIIRLLVILFIICIPIIDLGCTNYYLSTSIGDDSRTIQQAQNMHTPWKSIKKINTITNKIQPGDSVLFRRAEVFYGSLYISIFGNSHSPITFGAYGEGVNPQISGLSTLNGWISKGTNLWEATCELGGNELNNLMINNTPYQIGRYPNSTENRKGYRNIDSNKSNYQISDKKLLSIPNWTGAELVIRKNHWIIDRCQILNHSENRINYIGGSSYVPKNGWGYFIQNHPLTLDKYGEWYYNPKTKTVLLYTDSSNPSSMTIKTSTIETLLTLDKSKHLNFRNIDFNGSNIKTILLTNSESIQFKNCSINNSGINGIEVYNSSRISIENCNIINTNNNAIYFAQNCSISKIIGNMISKTGIFPGMGLSGDGTYMAVNVEGYQIKIENNTIDKTGYIPICFRGDSTIIKNNVISNFLLTKDDGGGIYGGGSGLGCKQSVIQKKSFIVGNIITNGIGAPEGTNYDYDCANGIYLDDNASNIEIKGNTVVNMKSAGIFIHNSHKLKIYNNNLFDNGKQLYLQYNNCPIGKIRYIDFKNNVLCVKKSTQTLIEIFTTENDIDKFGEFDTNHFWQFSDLIPNIKVNNRNYYLKQWQYIYSKDLNSKINTSNIKKPENSIIIEYNATMTRKKIAISNIYTDVKNNKYSGAIILEPFSSIILLRK